MIAVLRWTDGFGNDTYVKGIYPSIDAAKRDYKPGDRWVKFEYGKVDFEWYEANEFTSTKSNKRKNK